MSRQRGFTLMETLIALVLMSLLLLALFGGFRAGVASWRAAQNQVVASESYLQLGRMLQRHMRQLLRSDGWVSAGTALELFFTAEPGRIRYVAPLALSVDETVYSIELASQPDGREGLWIRFVRYDAAEDMLALLEQEEYLLVDAEMTAQFEFYFQEEWHPELEAGVVPQLLRVSLSTPKRIWSSLVYAPGQL